MPLLPEVARGYLWRVHKGESNWESNGSYTAVQAAATNRRGLRRRPSRRVLDRRQTKNDQQLHVVH